MAWAYIVQSNTQLVHPFIYNRLLVLEVLKSTVIHKSDMGDFAEV